jgi:SAM-dependent methyltransferase
MNQQKRQRERWKDLAMTLVLAFLLMAVFYLVPPNTFNPVSAVVLFLLVVPTLMALIHGAPFVPTPMEAVEKMLKTADLKEGDKVFDIGCGDGRMVYLAAKKYKANATGYELSPIVYALARIRKLFWGSKAKIVFGNFKTKNFKDADVIMCYLLPETLARLQEKLDKELKKGARVVSYAFPIGSWKAHQRVERDPAKNIAPIWVYQK